MRYPASESDLFDALVEEAAITDIEHLRFDGDWRVWRVHANGMCHTRSQNETTEHFFKRVLGVE